MPDSDLVADGRSSQQKNDSWVEDLTRRLEIAEVSLQQIKSHHLGQPPLFAGVIRSITKPLSPHPDDSDFIDISHSLRELSLSSPSPDTGFLGKSSAAMLVKAAATVKSRGDMDSQTYFRSQPNPKPWMKPWENYHSIPLHNSCFPDDQPMRVLVELYFSNQLHKHNPSFGTILLLVCALGSLYLTDPAVSNQDRQKLGWNWYNQVELYGQSVHQAPTLYDIQAYCLAVQFLTCTSNPRFAWSIAGFGLTLAQDLGAHRQKSWAPTITIDEDLEKRAFWILSFQDTQLSATLGRSGLLDQVEIDVTLPSECDDEHWQPWGMGFQPGGKPSTMVFFNCLINLYRILHFVLRVFYTIHSNNVRMQRHPDLAHFTVELDSALDQWFSTLPQHLIWDPDCTDGIFLDQSAALYCFYYYTRIIIHRPFIPGVFTTMEPDAQALGICTEAAKACIGVASVQCRRRPRSPLFFSQSPVFTSAMVLVLNKWGSTNVLSSAADELSLVHQCIDILRTQHESWPSSEFFITVLERLVSLDGSSTEQFDDHQDVSHFKYLAANSNANASEIPTGAAPSRGSDSSSLDGRSWPIEIFPVLVGDEESIPRRGYRPPVRLLHHI
ncbi:fungal-specific transcription factor domain-containing protein [Mycena capillaripes]|nr:fungal-specific transcription factor domain-containing protein [Mycena capillaripes]